MLKIPNDYDFVAEVYTQDQKWLDVYCKMTTDFDGSADYEILQVVGGVHGAHDVFVSCPSRLDAFAECMIDIEFNKYLESLAAY